MLSCFQIQEFAKYPLKMHGRGISILMTWLIPYGLTSFYPASYLLGRDVGIMAWAGLLMAVFLLVPGDCVWLFDLRHYTSTGS